MTKITTYLDKEYEQRFEFDEAFEIDLCKSKEGRKIYEHAKEIRLIAPGSGSTRESLASDEFCIAQRWRQEAYDLRTEGEAVEEFAVMVIFNDDVSREQALEMYEEFQMSR